MKKVGNRLITKERAYELVGDMWQRDPCSYSAIYIEQVLSFIKEYNGELTFDDIFEQMSKICNF